MRCEHRRFSVLDLMFPPRCPFCSKMMPRWAPLCGDCQRTLPFSVGKQGRCDGEFFEVCVAPLWYRDSVRDSFHRFKFKGRQAYAKAYAVLMAQCVNDQQLGEFDVVTWSPINVNRRRRRGYDQSELLARELAKHLNLPVAPLLEKTRNTVAQSSIEDASARRANALGAYQILPSADIVGKKILLVDDIVTSGSTLSECARVLRTAGAGEIHCIVLAQSRKV